MGEKTSENLYCPHCGEITKIGKRFCHVCGGVLDDEEIEVKQEITQPIKKQQPIIIYQQQPQQVQQPQIQPQVTVIREPSPSNGAAETALVFAILGIFCLPFLGGFLAMLFGCCGAFTPYKRGTAIISFIIGLATSGLWIIPLVMFVIPGIASGIWFWM